MGFTIYLGNVEKPFNSTYQADVRRWHRTVALWKNTQDIDSPELELTLPGEYPQYNQFFIEEVQAYYWVQSILSVRKDVWHITGVMDVLATFRNSILGTTAYILYGFNADASGASYRLPDTRQNVSQVPIIATATADITGGAINTAGVYILTCVGKNGGVTAYKIAGNTMQDLLNSLGTDITDALGDLDSVEDILKYFTLNSVYQGNAISAIRSCIWLPLWSAKIPAGGAVHDIYLGDFNTHVSAVEIATDARVTATTTINIPWQASDWRRLNTQGLMYIPFVGTVSIPVDQINNQASLTVTWVCECIGGGVSVKVDAGDYTIYTGSANIAVNYPIGSSNVPISSYINGTVQAVGGALQFGGGLVSAGASMFNMAGNAFSGFGQMAEGIGDIANGVMQALQPVVQCAGTLTGSAAYGQSMLAKLTLLYFQPIDDAAFTSVYGHPVMRMATPVTGYCQTRGFSMADKKARAAELTMVNRLMDGGVFIV